VSNGTNNSNNWIAVKQAFLEEYGISAKVPPPQSDHEMLRQGRY